ncbi:MAG: ABC transporter permease [Deltaproteobacteria bacterium]|nr:ABC transporter permease [Deltaproteobacteria bacterium]
MAWIAMVIALKEIRRNKLRSFLTGLGIVIGVSAVIVMVHLGKGASRNVTEEIASLGKNLLILSPGTRRRGPGGTRSDARDFDDGDVSAVEREFEDVIMAPLVVRPVTAVYANANVSTTAIGTTSKYLDIRDWAVSRGRGFAAHEVAAGSRVCILGQTVVDELFQGEGLLDVSFRIDRLSCRVIGVLEAKGQSAMGSDQDDIILMPLRTMQRRLAGNTDVSQIMVSVSEERSLAAVSERLRALFRERRNIARGAADDFEVRDMKEIAAMVEKSTSTLTALLGAIAAVSMLVGGIGIMNIMLVAVTERTREIGIRLALGARGREVLLQFLIEAGVLSTLGGLVGVLLGVGGSLLLTMKMTLPFVFVPEIVAVSFLFSAVVGIVFGFLPARRASMLDPIEALRHE